MVDTWLLLRDIELGGERNRLIYVLKSRGMAHSNQVREFLITAKGIKLVDAYLGAAGVLTGSARLSQESRERVEVQKAKAELARKKLTLEHRRKSVDAQIQALEAQFKAEQAEFDRAASNARISESQAQSERNSMAKSRRVAD